MVGMDSADSQLSLYIYVWGSVGVLTFNLAQFNRHTVVGVQKGKGEGERKELGLTPPIQSF
jgi:hypothetical protein